MFWRTCSAPAPCLRGTPRPSASRFHLPKIRQRLGQPARAFKIWQRSGQVSARLRTRGNPAAGTFVHLSLRDAGVRRRWPCSPCRPAAGRSRRAGKSPWPKTTGDRDFGPGPGRRVEDGSEGPATWPFRSAAAARAARGWTDRLMPRSQRTGGVVWVALGLFRLFGDLLPACIGQLPEGRLPTGQKISQRLGDAEQLDYRPDPMSVSVQGLQALTRNSAIC